MSNKRSANKKLWQKQGRRSRIAQEVNDGNRSKNIHTGTYFLRLANMLPHWMKG